MGAFSIAGFAFLALHPFTTFPLTLALFPKAPLVLTAKPPKSIALIFCCHNEAASIPAKLKNLRTLLRRYPGLSVHIYLDACTDGTAKALGKSHPRIRIVEGKDRKGKNAGINTLIRGINADLLAFNDANVLIDANAFQNVSRYFEDPHVGCVCAQLLYINGDDSSTARTGGLYWRFEETLKRAESQRGSTVAVDGSLFFIRRHLFSPLPLDVPNDFYTSMDILARGWRVVSAPEVLCFEKSATNRSDEFRRKVRITTRAMTTHLMLRRKLRRMNLKLQYFYLSHKLMRWFTFYWLALATASLAWWLCISGHQTTVAVIAIISASALALGLRRHIGIVEQVFDILSAFAATAWGATRALIGFRVSKWTIPGSSR